MLNARRTRRARPVLALLAAGVLVVSLLAVQRVVGAASSPLPAVASVAHAVSAGARLRVASASVEAQLPNNEYAWLPDSTCLATAIDSTNATPCVLGDTTATATVVLVGDSSADEWAPDLGALGSAHGFRVVVYVHSACPVGDVLVELAGHGVDPSCATFRADVLADLAAMDPAPDLVVASELRLPSYETATGGKLTNAAWSKALTATLGTLVRHDGDPVLLLHGVPVARLSPADCIAANPSSLTACNTRRSASDPKGYDAAAWSGAKAAHAAGTDVLPLFCTTKVCPSVSAGDVMMSGVDHVTQAYATDVADALGELLGCAATQSFSHATRSAAVLDTLGTRTHAWRVACSALAS